MKVVIAIDSFKGSMSSIEVGEAAKRGIQAVYGDAKIVVKPLADGGEGTTEALIDGFGGEYVSVEVSGPLGERVTAQYGILPGGRTAVIEMAQAAGLVLLQGKKLDPLRATTYGVGEIISDALQRGCREFIVGIGGSATSDGGVGMLQALGFEFLDADGCCIRNGIEDLDKICNVNMDNVYTPLRECSFHIACDVKNPLCGPNGAVFVYGSQKGIEEEEKARLDAKMSHYADITRKVTGADWRHAQGVGAAGGLGFAFRSYFEHVELKPGVEIVLDAIGLEQVVAQSDIVITGEGRIDGQTAMGKVPVGVAALAKKYHNIVIAFAGGIGEGAAACHSEGIDACFPIVRDAMTLEKAMQPEIAKENMKQAVEQVFRLLRASGMV